MGWCDCHLHEFQAINPKYGCIELIGIPNDEWGGGPYGYENFLEIIAEDSRNDVTQN